MSQEKELSILEQMKQQHAMYCKQRDQAQVNFQQLIGAIYALDSLIKNYEEKNNDKINDNAEEQPTEE